jgi:1,2-diacylglycerol 3-alpha-glucosyltransferase
MNVFAFASRSETQGIVLTEAMAAGLPVVALDAPGVREVVQDKCNGRLLQEDTAEAFRDALAWMAALTPEQTAALKAQALAMAENYSRARCADRALACYEALISRAGVASNDDDLNWEDVFTWIKTEWTILKSVAEAGDAAIGAGRDQERGAK